MNEQTFGQTRQTLHGVAEFVLAGPQYALSQTVRLRVTPGGFGTVTTPHLRVEERELVSPSARIPLEGTFASLARGAGVEARSLRDVYAGGPAIDPDDPLVLDTKAVEVLLHALADGHAALRSFAPEQEPVLWPEHFDIAIVIGEANYGFSPGDELHAEPYAYVGPFGAVEGELWNATGFPGAELTYAELLAAPDPRAAALEFFTTRKEALA